MAVFTAVSPFLAAWKATHIFNPLWPPHAKFHNGHTMMMGALLGSAALLFTWRRDSGGTNVLAALVFAATYWVGQSLAFLVPNVAWTDPNLLAPGQSLDQFPMQLILDTAMLVLIAVAGLLMIRGAYARSRTADQGGS